MKKSQLQPKVTNVIVIDPDAEKVRVAQAAELIRAYNEDPSLSTVRRDQHGKLIPYFDAPPGFCAKQRSR